MTPSKSIITIGVLLASTATAAPGDKANVVRDLAGRVGSIIGSALVCKDIARPRIQGVVDKFTAVIREAASNETERADLTLTLDRSVAAGRDALAAGKTDCIITERQLADLERSTRSEPETTSAASTIGPTPAAAATTPGQILTAPVVRGVTDKEIRFGIVAPFSGAARELGRQMKLGIDTAFSRVNDAGGIDGRSLRLMAAD